MIGFDKTTLNASERAPLVLMPSGPIRELAALVRDNSEEIASLLLVHGAILFRGFPIDSVSAFEKVTSAISTRQIKYTNRSTPRTAVGTTSYTATEYPAQQEIVQHNECSYQRDWPLKLAFCCLVAPASGGETPIADMRKVTAMFPPSLVDLFTQREVRYVRNYRPYVDLPWQTVFQTEDRTEVAEFCEQHGIQLEWIAPDVLRTTQISQGTAVHPVTGERVYFNQAHLFHWSNLEPRMAEYLIKTYGLAGLPRNSYFGDGSDIDPDVLQTVRASFRDASFYFRWERGDLLLLDNMQFAHGRRPFVGARQIVAALLDPLSGPHDDAAVFEM